MKRKISKILIIFILMLTGCKFNSYHILKNIEIDNDSCKIVRESESHGGFLGDGDYFVKIICNDFNYDKLSNHWKELPLSKSLQEVIDMKWCDSRECMNLYEKYNISPITNGYYYFIDRHSESKNKYDDTNLNNRSSWNFTLGIIDKDSNSIYYYELDT